MKKKESWNFFQIKRNPVISRWSVVKGGKIAEYASVDDLYASLKKWTPFSPVLISKPYGCEFVAATKHSEISLRLANKYNKGVLVSLGLSVIAVFFIFFSALITQSIIFWKGFILFSLVSLSVWVDYSICSKNIDAISERSLFSYWAVNSKSVRLGTIIWLVFMAASASAQWILQYNFGGKEDLIANIGVVYDRVIEGQVWRLWVGPLLHSSPAHFFNNLLFLLLVGPVMWAIYGYRAFMVFFVGNFIGPLSATLQSILDSQYPYDAYSGVSSGVFSLYGYLFMSGILSKSLLPKGLAIHVGFLAVISIAVSEVYVKNSATVAHCVGLSTGLVILLLERVDGRNQAKEGR